MSPTSVIRIVLLKTIKSTWRVVAPKAMRTPNPRTRRCTE